MTPAVRLLVAAACLAVAAALGAASLALWEKAPHPGDFAESAPSARACAERGRAFSLNSNVTGRTVTFARQSVNAPMKLIDQASYVIATCQGFELSEFCLGTACKESSETGRKVAFKMTLTATERPERMPDGVWSRVVRPRLQSLKGWVTGILNALAATFGGD